MKTGLPERKRMRLKEYDYVQNGAYFVTICTKDRNPLLWNVGAISDRPIGLLPLSDIGKIVNNEINQLSGIYQIASVDKSVIMPNHVHMIILICGKQGGRPEDAPTISRMIQQFKGLFLNNQVFLSGKNLSMSISSETNRNILKFGNTSIRTF